MDTSRRHNGTVLEIYVNGVLAGRNSFADVDPIPRYLAPLKTYGKFTVGSGWAGQLDEVRVHATALDGDASTGSKQCPARFRNRYGGLGMPEHLNPNTMASVTFNDGGNGGEGAKGIVKASMRRGIATITGTTSASAATSARRCVRAAPGMAPWPWPGRRPARVDRSRTTGRAHRTRRAHHVVGGMGPVPNGGHLADNGTGGTVCPSDECGYTMPVGRTPQLKLLQRAFRYDAFPSDRFPSIDGAERPRKKTNDGGDRRV